MKWRLRGSSLQLLIKNHCFAKKELKSLVFFQKPVTIMNVLKLSLVPNDLLLHLRQKRKKKCTKIWDYKQTQVTIVTILTKIILTPWWDILSQTGLKTCTPCSWNLFKECFWNFAQWYSTINKIKSGEYFEEILFSPQVGCIYPWLGRKTFVCLVLQIYSNDLFDIFYNDRAP